ncbi:hypothetical protein AMJ86_01020 [bacterium SM23_57]|nr:MAG: hypothetical protein AMJ86_01020 [bacterium SM23_57]
MRKFSPLSIFLIFLFAAFVTSNSSVLAQWSVPVTVTDGQTSFNLSFGGDPAATDGFDAGLDAAAAPPGMTYYAFFEIVAFPTYLTSDIRAWVSPYNTDITWSLRVINAAGRNTTVSWNSANLPDGQFTFTLDGANGSVDMSTQNSVSFSGDKTLTISKTGIGAQNPVTFQCNMDIQIQSGTFDPVNDTLVVRGSFNGWSGTQDRLTDADSDKIYTLVVNLPDSLIGTEVEYKFVLIPAGGADQWESVSNRKFTLLAGGQILDVVYFNDQAVLSVTATVTFQADMSEMLDKGWFDPSVDSIRIVGGMNGWANTESMEPDPFDPSLYVYDASVTAAPGDNIEWKFRGYPTDHFMDNGWEAGSNHSFEFTGSDLVLDPLKPNVLPAGKPLSQDVTVRFSVDVNGALDWYNKQPFQGIKSVWVTGDWNNWGGSWGVSDTTVLIRMYDDGATGGDAVASDGIWTADVLFATGSSGTNLYKYSIYAAGVDTLNAGNQPMDNEAGIGMNHVVLIDDTNPLFVLPTDIFGSQWRETSVETIADAALPTEFELQQNYPNPFNPTTDIVYALPEAVPVNLSIYNSLGQKIATLVDQKQAPGSYRVTWNGLDLNGNPVASGIYFYHLEAGDFASTMKMLLVK